MIFLIVSVPSVASSFAFWQMLKTALFQISVFTFIIIQRFQFLFQWFFMVIIYLIPLVFMVIFYLIPLVFYGVFRSYFSGFSSDFRSYSSIFLVILDLIPVVFYGDFILFHWFLMVILDLF